MKYSKEEVIQYVQEEDVKFIRLTFCDVFGRQKNVSIMAEELPRAFEYGIAFDASAITGFGDETKCDLLLHPDAETLMPLPWRPEHGRVVRMFCSISYPDGTPFECDTRSLLKKAMDEAKKAGYEFMFGAEQEFYLFLLDEYGKPTQVPYDEAGYMDIAPEDRGENIRREICLTLEQMGIRPESSHHEEGPGQNEIDFRYSDAITAADNTMTFQTVVKTVAHRNGLCADFSAKPLDNEPGNGFHINISVRPDENPNNLYYVIAGILEKIEEKTGQEIRVTIPGHTQRGGSPCPYDRVLSTRFGAAAAEMIMQGDYGKLVGIKNGEIVRIPLSEVAGKLKTVDPDASIIKEAKAVGISFGD